MSLVIWLTLNHSYVEMIVRFFGTMKNTYISKLQSQRVSKLQPTIMNCCTLPITSLPNFQSSCRFSRVHIYVINSPPNVAQILILIWDILTKTNFMFITFHKLNYKVIVLYISQCKKNSVMWYTKLAHTTPWQYFNIWYGWIVISNPWALATIKKLKESIKII